MFSRSIIDNSRSRSIINDNRSVIDDPRVMVKLVVSFKIVI